MSITVEYQRDIPLVILPKIVDLSNSNELKKVHIDLQWNTSYISAIVEDEGDGFNWREKIYAPLNLGGENSRGRGLTLTERISNHYFYNTRGNKAYFVLVLDT